MLTHHTDLQVCESFKEDSAEKPHLEADWQHFDQNTHLLAVMKGSLTNASHATSSHCFESLQGNEMKKEGEKGHDKDKN